MPKWSEIPWGQVFTGITSATAIVVSILSYRRAGPKLRFTVRTGVIKTGWILAPGPPPRQRYVLTEVTSDRAVTLTTIDLCHFEKPWSWARLRNNHLKAQKAVLNNPNPEQPLPFELQPGGIWRGLTEETPELAEWGRKGVLYFDLYHSLRPKPVRKRVRFLKTPTSS